MCHMSRVFHETYVSRAGTTTQFLNLSNLIPGNQRGIKDPNQLLVPVIPLQTTVLPTEALPTPVEAAKSLEVWVIDQA